MMMTMMTRLSPRWIKNIKRAAGVSLSFLLLWYFFATRITTLAMYVMIGMKAPLTTRIECAKETEKLVTKKFSLPLAFDRTSKNGLRTFWHYSYYANCLQNHGYDHSGNTLPRSVIKDGRLINQFGRFSLAITDATLLSDNQVDADYDDRLILSSLKWQDKEIFVGFYKKYDPKTITDMKTEWTHFPHSDATFSSITVQDDILIASDSSGMSGCLRLWQDRPLMIYGGGLKQAGCTTLIKSLSD